MITSTFEQSSISICQFLEAFDGELYFIDTSSASPKVMVEMAIKKVIALGKNPEEAIGSGVVIGTVGMLVAGGFVVLTGTALPLVARVAIGMSIGLLNDYLREKIPQLKDFEDNIGKAVVSTWHNVVNFFSD